MKETPVSQRVQIELTNLGGLAMRNNVGVAFDATGRAIRYGLMNSSKGENETFKSSDLIDCIPVVIQPHHVGRTFGLFTAIETKRTDWKFNPDDARAVAQLNFIRTIQRNGGLASFVSDPAQIAQLIGIYR